MSSALLEERKAAIRRWTLLIFKIVLPLVALLCTIKKREKHPWKSVIFSEVAGSSISPKIIRKR